MLSRLQAFAAITLFFFAFACKQKSADIDDKEVPIIILNNTHINLSNYSPRLTRKQDLFYNSDIAFSGTSYLKSNEGVKLGKIHLENGMLNGSVEEWHANGQKKTKKNYINGYEDGMQNGWHDNGKISYEYYSKIGKIESVYKEYFPNGNLQIEKKYQDGLEIANKILDKDGKVIANYVKKDGRYYGLLGSGNCVNIKNVNVK